MELILSILGGPISLLFGDRAVDRQSAWIPIAIIVILLIAARFSPKGWRLGLLVLGALLWFWCGLVSLGPV